MTDYPADIGTLVGPLVLIVGLFVIATSAYLYSDYGFNSSCSLLVPCAEEWEALALMLFGLLLCVIGGYVAVSAATRTRSGRRG